MKDDWQIGDLAECIWDEWIDVQSCNPKLGQILRVADMLYFNGLLYLDFVSIAYGNHYDATAFRKIRPDTEPCDAGFLALVKRGRRVDA